MDNIKILYISQEITPYLPESDIANISRYLPQAIQEKGREIRTFMPRFGNVNERRNQLHEVIRLSGMNLIIDDMDHPLIIKVASIQAARMQVYFIDNEDFFSRKQMFADDNGAEFDDNDERTVFFARGVIETVKKLRWSPDLVHCHGWMTSLIPLYIKRGFKDDPLFSDAKIVYSLYNSDFKQQFKDSFKQKVKINNISDDDLSLVEKPDFENLNKLAIHYSDGIIQGSEKVNEELINFTKSENKPFLDFKGEEEYIEAYSDFYDTILEKST